MAHHTSHSNRPENVLKHAEDLIAINKEEQALNLLFDLLRLSRNQSFQNSHQDAMKKFLELCVNSRNSRLAKEGLHQVWNFFSFFFLHTNCFFYSTDHLLFNISIL